MRGLFATDRFTAGHVLGTGIVVFGTIGIARALIDRARAQSDATRDASLRQASLAAVAGGRGQRWGLP